jgi:hypothetical protein
MFVKLGQKNFRLLAIWMSVLAVGCGQSQASPPTQVQAVTSPVQATATPIPAVTVVPPVVASVSATRAETSPTRSPTSSPTVTSQPSPTPAPSPTVVRAESLRQSCLSSPTQGTVPADVVAGIAAYGPWKDGRGTGVMLDDSFVRHGYFVYAATGQSLPFVSSDGKWIASYTIGSAVGAGPLTLMATRLADRFESTVTFASLGFANPVLIGWADNSHIIVPLQNDGDTFKWLIWSPTTAETSTLAVDLPGTDQAILRTQQYPLPDPSLQLVIYPCLSCGRNQYQVVDTQNSKPVWGVEFGSEDGTWAQPAWSPDGKHVAVASPFGSAPAEMWIYNRSGLVMQTLQLAAENPFSAITNLSWSPDGQSMAFLLYGNAGDGRANLGLYSLKDGQFTDLCLRTVAPYWSPDSSKLVSSFQVEPGKNARTLTVADLQSGLAYEMPDPSGHIIAGWAAP